MNWKLIVLIAKCVLLVASLADAQIVKVEARWKQCSGGYCTTRSQLGTGTVIGRTAQGRSLVLGCKHQHTDAFHEQGAGVGTFDKLLIDGKTAHLLKLSDKHDLSLMWVEGDLGNGLSISEINAEIGAELSLQGFDGASTKLSGRPGTLASDGLTAVAVQGNSGGPIISRDNVVYGVTTGYSPVVNPNRTVFVCATDCGNFIKSVVPFGWVMWANPQNQTPNQPQIRSVPPPVTVLPDRESTARIVALERQVASLTDRIVALESARRVEPDTPPQEIPVPGKDGKPGADASDVQVMRAVQAWVAKNLDVIKGRDGPGGADGLPGRDGPAGPRGPAGLINVIVRWADGTAISEFKDVNSGSRIAVELDKTVNTKTTEVVK